MKLVSKVLTHTHVAAINYTIRGPWFPSGHVVKSIAASAVHKIAVA